MAIPDYPTLPSQEDARQTSRSRLGRTVMGGAWFLALLVLCLVGVVLVPGALILVVLLVGQGEWLLALAALIGLVAWAGALRFVGGRMTALDAGRKPGIQWDEHF